MSVSVGELEGLVLQILQKTPGTQGFYTPEKVYAAIQESVDYVSARMMEAASGGWMDEIRYYDTVSGQSVVQLQPDVIMIKTVRYLVGNTYVVIGYDEQKEASYYAGASGVTQFPSRFRVFDDKIFFNPMLGMGGPQYLMAEVTTFPKKFTSDGDMLPGKFNRAFQHYIKYRTASVLASSVGKFNKEWMEQQNEWLDVMMRLIDKRVDAPAYVREWDS